MTINVQNDIVTLQHASSDHWSIQDEAEHLKFRKKGYEVDDEDTATTLSNSSKDTDDDSVLSTQSSFPTSRVSFSEDLVTMEWTRPYTKPEDIPLLYYSTEETNRFRHDYRLERKMLSSLNVDNAFLEESSDASGTCLRRRDVVDSLPKASQSCYFTAAPPKRSISRVLILHNDKVESFSESYCTDNAYSSDFFDTPEFWSGSITWW